ncbi:TetR/AcrR family transcriptional regulator [Roseibium sp.]|uniref:TetR/AcrR family transcriptional regulator n=1 Tax=Roseibium sp. TaxID=1936156 RepID=UPI003A96A898
MTKATLPRSGRPRQHDLTRNILDAALASLADEGYEATTIAQVAQAARTSKQAIYRRWPNKEAMIAAAIEQGFAAMTLSAPERRSVSQDLLHCLGEIVTCLQETPLGNALKSTIFMRNNVALSRALHNANEHQRLILRQILIATPFEVDMEVKIDLLLGLPTSKIVIQGQKMTPEGLESAIEIVLGLTAPRAPARAPVPFP